MLSRTCKIAQSGYTDDEPRQGYQNVEQMPNLWKIIFNKIYFSQSGAQWHQRF